MSVSIADLISSFEKNIATLKAMQEANFTAVDGATLKEVMAFMSQYRDAFIHLSISCGRDNIEDNGQPAIEWQVWEGSSYKQEKEKGTGPTVAAAYLAFVRKKTGYTDEVVADLTGGTEPDAEAVSAATTDIAKAELIKAAAGMASTKEIPI